MQVYVTDASYASLATTPDQEPSVDQTKYNSKGIIPVKLPWSPFADLQVIVYYNEDKYTRVIKNVFVTMKQHGWGLEGLTLDKNGISISRNYSVLTFDIDFTMKMSMPGIGSVALPSNFHDASVHGWYDFLTRDGAAVCNADGEEQGRGFADKKSGRHPE